MFLYQSLFRRNAGGEAGKIIGLTVLAAIMIAAVFLAVFIIAMLPMFAIGDSAWAILYGFIIFFLVFLSGIFIVYPLSIGIIKFFTSAYQGESYGFGDIFFVFREGRYGKAVKLTILVIIANVAISFAISFVMQLVLTLINLPFSAALGGLSYENGLESGAVVASSQIGLFILMLAVNLLVILLMYIPSILLMIYMFLLYLVFVDQPHIPTFDKFTIAFKVMFQAGQSLVKLFFSNILLLIGVTVLYIIFVIGAALLGSLLMNVMESGVLLVLTLIVGGLVMLGIYIYVMYLMLGSVVAYYFNGRSELDRRVAEEVSNRRDETAEYDEHAASGELRPLDDRNY